MHTVVDHEGMKVLRITAMQPVARTLPKPGDKPPAPQPTKNGPVDIVHVTAIAEFYGIDVQDVWPLVHMNVIGRRVPYNTQETKVEDVSYVHWEPTPDQYGNIHMEREIRFRDEDHETDDGMYVRLSDVLRYAKQHGWKRGAGLPDVQAKSTGVAAGEDLKDILAGIVKVLERQGEMLTALGEPKPRRAQ